MRAFFLHRPTTQTLIPVEATGGREDFGHRIRQRLGISVDDYAVLNIHRIGIDAPVRHVFDELMFWGGDSTCWPNHIAKAKRVDDGIRHIRILLLGIERLPFNLGRGRFGLSFIPLFDMRAEIVRSTPSREDVDNARYLLFKCSGGYPIGHFAMYIRSPIPTLGESEQAQLFFVVGFNFYGRTDWTTAHPVNKMWEAVHNRVTSNILHRFKRLCEWRFRKIQEGRRHF